MAQYDASGAPNDYNGAVDSRCPSSSSSARNSNYGTTELKFTRCPARDKLGNSLRSDKNTDGNTRCDWPFVRPSI